uniref:Uncharacterized protein n=1 Tax=Panagrolaimus sp. ES5 TaxID=591445 RepID=A0AC34F309_9BILA
MTNLQTSDENTNASRAHLALGSENLNRYIDVPDAITAPTTPTTPDLLFVPTWHRHKLSITSSNASELSVDSFVSTISTVSNGEAEPWPYNHFAKNYLTSLLTVFYAVILIIYAVVLELQYQMTDKEDKKHMKQWLNNFYPFMYYVYGVAFLFFAYCYVMVLIKPKRLRIFRYLLRKFGKQNSSDSEEETEYETAMPNVGSLYLRLGAVGKKVYKINKTIAYYIATTTAAASSESSEEEVEEAAAENYTLVRLVRAAADVASTNSSAQAVTCSLQMECVFGSFTKVFYTAVVEYSLIAAAVMFIVWHNIERVQDHQLTHRVHKKSTIRINCSKTIFGLFAGFGFLAGTFISMALFYGFSGLGKYYEAAKVYNVTDLVQHCIGIIACVFALWRIRLLNYVYHNPHTHNPHHAAHANQELLDMILLAIGLIGELMFSISGLVGICNMRKWESFASTLIAAHVSRIIQAVFQCCLICIASKLKVSSKRKHEQPGKQTITFLIIVNIAIFIMNLFESDKVGTSEAVVNFYGKENWVFLVRTFSPLTIFYRFHSSVCLAEIWKSTYATKHH